MLTYHERKMGWWREERAVIECVLPADGQLAVFNLAVAGAMFDAFYPRGPRGVWYFNSTRDREIAETNGERIYANPSVLSELGLLR